MEIFQPSVVQVDPSSFNPEAYYHIHQLSLTTDLSSITQTVQAVGQHVYYIYGEPGSGCTTLVQGIYQHVCSQSDTLITESNVLYVLLNQLCSQKSFYDFVAKLAKQRNGTVLFKQSSEKIDQRKQIVGEFLYENFKFICVDNAESCGSFIDDFLVDILKTCKRPCFVVFHQSREGAFDSGDFVSMISVNGLKPLDAKSLACKELHPLTLPEDQLSMMCDLVHNNPAAIQVVCGIITGLSDNDHIMSVLQNISTSHSSKNPSYAMDIIVELIKEVSQLQTNVDKLLHSLSCLRQPLPMLEISSAFKELIKVKLLFVSHEDSIHFISVNPALKKFMMSKKNFIKSAGASFDCLKHWLSLVSNRELCKLIKEAEENAWPFVPEPW